MIALEILGARTIDQKDNRSKAKTGTIDRNEIIQVEYWPIRFKRSLMEHDITCSFVIDSYQIPRAAKSWP